MNIFPPHDETFFFTLKFWKPGQSMLASALETISLCEIGPQLKLPSVGGLGSDIISFFLSSIA